MLDQFCMHYFLRQQIIFAEHLWATSNDAAWPIQAEGFQSQQAFRIIPPLECEQEQQKGEQNMVCGTLGSSFSYDQGVTEHRKTAYYG